MLCRAEMVGGCGHADCADYADGGGEGHADCAHYAEDGADEGARRLRGGRR